MELRLENVSFVYSSPVFGDRRALSDVSLVVPSGRITGIVGASGSGKTTLVQLFNGLLRPTEGRVFVGEEDLSGPDVDWRKIRREVGLAFQFPEVQLFEETVLADVSFGPVSFGLSREDAEAAARRALEFVGLPPDAYGGRSPFSLSGGESRRAALAGVFVMEPGVLILDEPTAGLDEEGTRRVEGLIREYHSKGRSVVCVSHHMDFIARLADSIVVLSGGRVRFDGGKDALFGNPDLVREAGLELPGVTRVLRRMREGGVKVRTDVYTVEEAKEELRRAGRGSGAYGPGINFSG